MDLHTSIVVGVCMHLQTFNDSEEQPLEIYTRACVYTRTCLKVIHSLAWRSLKRHTPQKNTFLKSCVG